MADPPFTRARVRVVQSYRASNPYGDRNFIPGEELEMIRWPGGAWATELTVDTSFIVPRECVEVLEVLGDE